MADLYKKFQQDSLFRIFKNGGGKGFRDIIEDPDKLKKNVLAHRDFKKKNKIGDIDDFINDIEKFVGRRDKRILDRVKLLDDFSKDPNEENYLLLDKYLPKASLNRFDFKKGMIPSETKTKTTKPKEIEIVVEADGSSTREKTKEEKELEEKTLKQLKDLQEDQERREKEMKADKEMKDKLVNDMKKIQVEMEKNDGKMMKEKEEKEKLENQIEKIKREVESTKFRMEQRKSTDEPKDIDLEEDEEDFLREQRRRRKGVMDKEDEEKEKVSEKLLEEAERSRMSKEDEEGEKVRKKLLEDAEKELGDVVDKLDSNRRENAEIRKEQTLKKDGRIKKVEERKNNKEFEELTNREAQIQKDIKKLSKSVAEEPTKKAMERMEAIKEEDEEEEDDEDFLELRRKQKATMKKEESEKKEEEDEDDEDDDEIEVMNLPDDEEELRTPREPEPEEKEDEKVGFHAMPDGSIMSGETHSSSSKPVDPMTISKADMKKIKDKQDKQEKQEQGIMDIPTGLTPLPEDRRSAEAKSVAQLKSDINYFFKNYGEILKPQIKQYRTLKKTKENLKNFHRRIVGILIPDMKEAMDGKKIGIVLDAEQYLNNKINEILLQKITEGLRPEDLLVDVTKPDDSQKRTGKQYGSYIVKGDRAGKLASERAPVFRAIPSTNDDKMEDPYKYEEKSNDIQMLRSQRWSKVNSAKKKVRIDPFIRYSKPSQIEIRL